MNRVVFYLLLNTFFSCNRLCLTFVIIFEFMIRMKFAPAVHAQLFLRKSEKVLP